MADFDRRSSALFTAEEGKPTGETHGLSAEEERARGRRNIAIALGVVAFIILVFLTTFFRLAESVQGAG